MLSRINIFKYNKKYLNTLVPWITQNNIIQHKIISADGCHIFTHDKKIVDFTSGLMVVNLGHNNKYIMDGIHKHLDTGISYVSSQFATDQREKLSERLIDITQYDKGKVFYTLGGADANETAIFIVHEYHKNFGSKKKTILSFKKSFHGGSTIASSLLSGDSRVDNKKKTYSLNLESIMENPSMHDGGIASLLQIKQLLKNDDIAAIIIEGSSGTAGVILYPDKYLEALEDICRQNNVLIICDEVMSGWGRTGEVFAYMKHKIKPDIITSAKGLTSGYAPLGVVIVKNNIVEIYNNKPFLHGLTYFAHPLSCTIANRCLDLYLENNREIIKNADLKGIYLNKLGNKLCDSTDIVYEYRNNGLLGCIELKIKNENILKQISDDLLKNNIYCFRRNNYIYTAPPLTISLQLLKDTIDKIQTILQKY